MGEGWGPAWLRGPCWGDGRGRALLMTEEVVVADNPSHDPSQEACGKAEKPLAWRWYLARVRWMQRRHQDTPLVTSGLGVGKSTLPRLLS